MVELVPISQPGTVAILPADDRVKSYLRKSKADSTQRIYRSDWKHFLLWAAEYKQPIDLPIPPETVARFISHLADTGSKVPTIRRKLAAIALAHDAAGMADAPTRSPLVVATMQGIHRAIGVPAKQKSAAGIRELRAMVATLPKSVRGIRDKALLLFGFASACRRSELVALDVEDIQQEAEGLRVTIRRSKTDQLGQGFVKGVPEGAHLETCPVRAYLDWLAAAHITSGPAFRAVDRHGNVTARRCDERAVARAIQDAAKAAGINPRQFGAHSLRAGLVTEADKAGVPISDIMAQTGHKRVDTVLKYVRDKKVLGKQNAARKVGL